jgi:ATP-dependent helicase/nuclease subunit A
MKRDHASDRQIQAADPAVSTWLSANAGSGKTSVLTDRVARLLLGGVPPQNILCLTYTKAAASEMQNRLFRRLGEWAMKEDGALIGALEKLGVDDTGDLNRARRLFARAIETPGGLKIQTIHSFCAALLRRFPLEAGVSPQFSEMDERAARILQRDIVEGMASGPDAGLVANLAQFYSGEDFAALSQEISANRGFFTEPADKRAIWGWFGLAEDFDEQSLEAASFAPGDGALLSALVPLLASGSATEVKAGALLSRIQLPALSALDLVILEDVFLFKTGKNPNTAKIGSFPTKALRGGAAAGMMPALDDLMARIEHARSLRTSLYSARKSLAFHRFALRFLSLYEVSKQQRGWLDFDDLIRKASSLLHDPVVSSWVLYKLEGQIDHVLVDEAQDTSPAQWQVIERLTQEFTSGEGARAGVSRTIFVVGDQKQSIYSFQGAEPAEFSRMRELFGAGLKRVGQPLVNLPLEYSFRSSPAILELVDHCLAGRPGLGDVFHHHAFFKDRPGRVDLWPVVEKTEFEEDRKWTDPVDRPAPENHVSRLATRVAEDISRKLGTELVQGPNGEVRPVAPGDILVLVRKRSGGLFEGIIRACKERGLPIAGADRLRVGGELAVRDLTALMRFLATPEDDLSLAAVLRSPLFGWSEARLFEIAHGRGNKMFLWSALSEAREKHADTIEILHDLRNTADFLRPYDLIERVLTRHRGRENLLARLGSEAEDGIDAFLAQALAYERLETPSLTGFLMWLDADEVTIKRQVDTASNQIRVMTVHGAKGLEARIVYLPDSAKSGPGKMPELIPLENGNVVWRPPVTDSPDPVNNALERMRQRDQEEWIRLLYVAMTRAEQWLIIGAAGDVGEEDQSWYRIIEKGMRSAGALNQVFPGIGAGKRHETGTWALPRVSGKAATVEAPAIRPRWLSVPAEPPNKPPSSLAPSDLGGAKALPGEAEADTEASLRRGRQIHRLLEFLPPYPEHDRPAFARAILSQGEDAADVDEAEQLSKEVGAILAAPDLQFLFEPGSLAEVEITATIPEAGGRRIHGAIDRLVIDADRVLAVDFKSNALVPDKPEQVPEGILRQMGAYRAALSEVFPGRTIETAVLWTSVARLMPLPDDLLRLALSRLDDTPSCS